MTIEEALVVLEALAESLHTIADDRRSLGPDALDFIADQIDTTVRGLKK